MDKIANGPSIGENASGRIFIAVVRPATTVFADENPLSNPQAAS